jgi:shikimate kinase
MNIVLTGFMGTGKTAVGRRVAEILKAPFHDADREIVAKAGRSVSELFANGGEAEFRRMESSVVEALSRLDKVVIATGGGAIVDPRNREHLLRNGILVCLTARMGTLLDRLKDDVTRPLLTGENMEQKLERLMKERETIYSSCPIQIETDGKSVAQVADEIVKAVASQWAA